MSLYFVFTVDGDWGGYFSDELSRKERKPDKKAFLELIRHEIDVSSAAGVSLLHFVHTSPVARQYFLLPDFTALWKEIRDKGGSIGVHCHEESLFTDGKLDNAAAIEESIRSVTEPLRNRGLKLISYRGGYLTFCRSIIPILERNGIALDFSCDPGRHLRFKGNVIADWRGAPDTHYRMSYEDHRRPGNSKVLEIPLGKAGGGTLYIEITSLFGVWRAARALAKRAKGEKKDIVVSVLSHTYEFSSFMKRLKIKIALLICRKYGIFISDEEVLDIIDRTKSGKKE